VIFRRSFGKLERLGDFAIGLTRRHQAQHLEVTRRERVVWGVYRHVEGSRSRLEIAGLCERTRS
jgi:hypothetical protein